MATCASYKIYEDANPKTGGREGEREGEYEIVEAVGNKVWLHGI